MLDFLQNYKFDPLTAIITLLFIPAFLVIRKIVLKHVKDIVTYSTEGVMYFVSVYVKQSIAATLSLKKYCKLQLGIGELNTVYIPSRKDISRNIEEIFVSVTIQHTSNNETNLSYRELLNLGNRIKIMGDPGSGKSTLIKRMYRQACKRGAKGVKDSKFPILIELKNIDTSFINKIKDKDDSSLGKYFYDYIKEKIVKNNVYKIDECLDSFSTTKGLMIFLDGLDEVSSINYILIAKCLNSFSYHLNELSESNIIILTMRTQFYQQVREDFVSSFQYTTFLKPFTPSDIYKFLTLWHFESEGENNISRIYKDLTDRPTLREMCSNPLVLSMYVAEDQSSQNNISPDTRTDFYRKITEELIIKRRQRQKLNTSFHTSLREQRERILGKIAFNHLIESNEPKNCLSWISAIKIIKQVMNCNDQQAELLFNEISKETGLITEERHRESFRFIHLSFCEFLAAFETVQGITGGWILLKECHIKFLASSVDGRSRLIEVIPFTLGLMNRVDRVIPLRQIFEFKDLPLLAKCFLETKIYDDITWEEFINMSKNDLLGRSVDQFDERWISDLHIFNVVVRDSNLAAENLNIIQNIGLSNFYETILESNQAGLTKILSSFANHDAAAVFRLCEICSINLLKDHPNIIIDNCDQYPFLGLIKDKIAQNNQDSINWAILLCESALQKKLVARMLNEFDESESLSLIIKNNKYEKIWHLGNSFTETFYTQCLTLCVNSNVNNHNTKRLSLLKEFKTPNECKDRKVIHSIIQYSFLFLLIFSTVVYFRKIILNISDKLNMGINVNHIPYISLYNLILVTYSVTLILILATKYFTFSNNLRKFYLVVLNLIDYDSYNSKLSSKNIVYLILNSINSIKVYPSINNKKYKLLLEKMNQTRV